MFLLTDCFPKQQLPKGRMSLTAPKARIGAALAPSVGRHLPAVHHNGAAEEVAESVHSPSQLEKQVRILRHAMVWPAGELDVSHLSPGGLLFFLGKR